MQTAVANVRAKTKYVFTLKEQVYYYANMLCNFANMLWWNHPSHPCDNVETLNCAPINPQHWKVGAGEEYRLQNALILLTQ